MAYTQAQWVADFRDAIGDTGSNGWSDYQLITATRRAYESAWPDFWLPYLDTTTYTRYASVAPNTNLIPVPSAFIGRDIFNIYVRTNVYQQGTAFTNTALSSTFTTTVAHGLPLNQAVQLDGSSLPGGFTNGTTYYIKTAPTSTTFTLSATVGGAAIASTTSGSGYVGTLFTDTSYKDFTKLERGLKIDQLELGAPYIRFNQVWGAPYELWIDGAAPLVYPTLTVTTTASNATMSFTSTDSTFSAVAGDKVYFFATAPGGFTATTPYYIINPTTTTFQLSTTSNGSAVLPTTSRTYTVFADNNTLPGTDFEWFTNFLRFQGEVNVTRERQRSGNLDRRAMAQRRLLAAQDVTEARSHRQRPKERTTFRWVG